MIMAMTLRELLEGWVDEAPVLRITGIGLDNRSIKPGDAFVAVQGQLAHGLDFARAAVAAGAVAVIHDGLQALPTVILFSSLFKRTSGEPADLSAFNDFFEAACK